MLVHQRVNLSLNATVLLFCLFWDNTNFGTPKGASLATTGSNQPHRCQGLWVTHVNVFVPKVKLVVAAYYHYHFQVLVWAKSKDLLQNSAAHTVVDNLIVVHHCCERPHPKSAGPHHVWEKTETTSITRLGVQPWLKNQGCSRSQGTRWRHQHPVQDNKTCSNQTNDALKWVSNRCT